MASAKDLRLEKVEWALRGYFDRSGGRAPGVLNRGIEEIRYETHIESPEDAATISALAAEAESQCYVLSTLKRAVRLSGQIFHNGQLLRGVTHSG